MGAQNANSRQLPDINETVWAHTPHHTAHNTKTILLVNRWNVKGICSKVCLWPTLFCLPWPNTDFIHPLTKNSCRDKMAIYAGMVELVDSVDLGSTARACRFESCCPHQIKRRGISLSFLFGQHGTRTHLNASVRWTLAATSSKTGGFFYFLFSLRKKKMQIDSGCRHIDVNR